MFTMSKTRKDDRKIREDKFVECNYGIFAYEPQGLWLALEVVRFIKF